MAKVLTEFYCPKCGEWLKVENLRIAPGFEFTCPECGVTWGLSYEIVDDPEVRHLTPDAADGAKVAMICPHGNKVADGCPLCGEL